MLDPFHQCLINSFPPPSKELRNTFRIVTTNNIANLVHASKKDSMTGKDKFPYRMITVTAEGMLAEIFTNLLRHRGFLAIWKITKSVPILKPGRSNMAVPKNL